jgi:hypothetical protein
MMKKITLNLDALTVESFETNNGEGGAGTVQAHMPAPVPVRTLDPGAWTCNPYQGTCDGCDGTIVTYCGGRCSDTGAQYDTCWNTCIWP